jgi:uncharacterized repeat protein (TIGR03803 family)
MLRFASICSVVAGSLVAAAVTAVPAAHAAGLTVVYAFCAETNCSDGNSPRASLITDGSNNLYGTTYYGGNSGCTDNSGCGTVFKITPSGAESVVYAFGGGSDGANPTASLLLDSSSNLYGTTSGGTTDGWGNVFKIAPDGTESVLHQFTGGSDGGAPYSGLIADAQGNLYGTAPFGGYAGGWPCSDHGGCGVVYELSPGGAETVLHTFVYKNGQESAAPFGGLTWDAQGNLYGATMGNHLDEGDGDVFRIAPDGTYSALFFWTGPVNGAHPTDSLLPVGKYFYGTTTGGGHYRAGSAFKITEGGKLTVLHIFTGGADGGAPFSSLIEDKRGNFYSTTEYGGANNLGTIFKITPKGKETVVYSFTGGNDGEYPVGGLIAVNGYFYGTTSGGGQYGGGTIFKIRK